jgi:hypothetical protein
MEQQLAGGGTPYLRTLYADPGKKLRLGLPHPSLGEDGYFAGLDEEVVAQRLIVVVVVFVVVLVFADVDIVVVCWCC